MAGKIAVFDQKTDEKIDLLMIWKFTLMFLSFYIKLIFIYIYFGLETLQF
jgi:hypothetical protein